MRHNNTWFAVRPVIEFFVELIKETDNAYGDDIIKINDDKRKYLGYFSR